MGKKSGKKRTQKHPLQKNTYNNQQPPNQKNQEISILKEEYSGILPLPSHLLQYEQVIPGAADRIICMAENQMKHRFGMEDKVISSDTCNAKRGVVFAFIICVLALTIGGYLISIDKAISGGLFAGTIVVTLVGTFIYGTNQRRQERESRQERENHQEGAGPQDEDSHVTK
ncbi:MAG: DUF2335 domain-containing protein [candidate division Zixibacteria bacterium]|nr:DUF2335 domain-containing protein [candidate division Zixibacteria bacterium]